MSAAATDGLEAAWRALDGLDPGDVCARAEVRYDPAEAAYRLTSLGQPLTVAPGDRTVSGESRDGRLLLAASGESAALAVLCYLAHARRGVGSEELIKPQSLPGGRIYDRGAHVLPLDRLTRAFGSDLTAFESRCARWGGERLDLGDASFRLEPLPKVPVVVVLWRGDPEFPARSDILFTADCPRHLPPDILWAVAALTVSLLLS